VGLLLTHYARPHTKFLTVPVPIVITSGQLLQAAIFSGRTSLSIRTYRIQSASQSSGRGGTTYRAQINPYHCLECITPTVVVDRAAYDTILAGMVDAPVNRNYPWDNRRRTTNLCMRFTVERAGAAERLRLAHAGPYTKADLYACPVGAQ